MRTLILICLLCPVTAFAATYSSDHHDYRVDTVAQGMDHPWAMAFLPSGDTLITERAGQLRLLRDGQLLDKPVSGVPEVAVAGQGGLLDIELHPDFQQNRRIVLSYAHETRDGMTTRVAKAQYRNGALTNVTPIFTALPRSNTSRHFAGRMAFGDQGHLFVSVGDRGEMERAQDFDDNAGGVHRITMSGEAAPGNPYLDDPDVNDTFYTVGNRNIQGMTPHPETGVIWTHEHGPRGGDEVNIIRAGTNYGWPVITHGIGYSGLPISDKTHKEGMAQPLHFWDPSIAPSGMTFYNGDRFPDWQGDLFVGALKFQKVVRLRINDGEVTEEEDLLTDLNARIRAVRQGPDGALWVLTDSSNGKLLRMTPAQSGES